MEKEIKSNRFEMACVVSYFILMILNSHSYAQINSKADWDAVYKARYGDSVPLLDIYNGDEKGQFSWHAHYWIRAFTSLAYTYRDTSYIKKAISLIDHILLYTDDDRYARGELDLENEPYVSAPLYFLKNRSEAAPGWRNGEFGDGWRIQTLNDGQITNAIMRFADLVLSDMKFSAYHSKAKEYVIEAEKIVNSHDSLFEFNRFPDVPGTYYYPKSDGSGLWTGGVPFNHNATMAVTLLLLDKVLGGTQEYRKKAEAILDYFKSYAEIKENNSYCWNYNFRQANPIVEDFNHAHFDVSFFILAYRRGLELTEEDMLRFANTLTENIHQENGQLTWFIDGTNDRSQDSYWPIGFDWIDLAEFNPSIFEIAKDFYANNYSNPTWSRPFLGWAEILRWSRMMNNNADNQPPKPPENIRVKH
jgi:hypothetical protein